MNNKINWLEWNKKGFNKSKKEKKPVLLSISAVWCHWCHNMDNLAYSNEEITKFINKNYIPIRVDTDKRPDINESYNMGGWPTTAILSSDGEVLNGATYLPIEDMLSFLKNGIDLFNQEIKPKIHEENIPLIPEKLSSITDFMNLVIDSFYDTINGGFGLEPKFPNFELLDYLFTQQKHKDILSKTLLAMAENHLQDSEAGGFYRYCTQQNWSIPHYEKMLEDNAKHLLIYLKAYEITKDEKYKQVAENTIRFLLTVLFDKKNGTFYSSQDADEAYCSLSLKEREKTKSPYIDKTVYADWNCLASKAFIKASIVLNQKKYLEIAQKNVDFIMLKCFKKFVIHYPDSEVVLLRDHIALFSVLLDAHETTKDKKYMKKSEEILSLILKNFYDSKNGAFYSTLKSDIGELAIRKRNIGENSLLCMELMRFDELTKQNHSKEIECTLLFFNNSARNYGFLAAAYSLAVEKFLLK